MRCACPGDSGDSSFHGGNADDLGVSRPTRLQRPDKVYCQLEAVSIWSELGKSVCRSSARMCGYAQRQKGWFVVRKLEFKLLQTENRTVPSCLVLRKKLQECRLRESQNGILAALVRPSQSAFPAEISTPGRPSKKRMTCFVEIFNFCETSAGVKYSASSRTLAAEVDSV